MTLSFLIVRNRLQVSIGDDLREFVRYVEEKTGFKVEYTYVESDFSLTHKPFITDKGGAEIYGLDGVKELVRTISLVQPHLYHAVIFLYDLDDTGFATRGKKIGHWTYFEPIVPGTEFVEIATTKPWDRKGDVFRVLTHEFFHVAHYRCRRYGVVTRDTMDEYDDEYEVYSEDGNRARNLRELAPHWRTVAARPWLFAFISVLELTARALGLQLKLRDTMQGKKAPEPAPPPHLDVWAEAIKQHEGWFVGSRSYRNNNPGNLRYIPYWRKLGAIGKDDKNFAIFASYADGFAALKHQLEIAATGKSGVYRPEMTLAEFFQKYAPANDNNDPDAYANTVARKLGVPVTTQIRDLVA